MIEKLFIQVLNMSMTACVAIAAVLLVRAFLRKAPRIFSYALWAVVLFRLLCPFSFSSAVSLFGVAGESAVEQGRLVYISKDSISRQTLQEEAGGLPADGAASGGFSQKRTEDSVNPPKPAVTAASWIWLCGMAVMAGYGIYSLRRFQKRLKGAVCLEDNIYSAECLATPFVIGFFRPKIYLPSFLKEEEKEYILLHEQTHIRRFDPALRMLSFAALCLHWFNPLVWLAYHISGGDMEMSCDEAVIRKLGDRVKKEYSASLLCLAAGRGMSGSLPLAFGEGDTKSRIKNVLHYKKPAFWGIAAAAALCAAAVAVLISNPLRMRRDEAAGESEGEYLKYYGVLKDADMEGTIVRVVTIPGIGDVELPEADEIYPWFETEYFELEAGDLVEISFPAEKEVGILEIYPARFSAPAESIVAIMRGQTLEYEGEDRWLYAFPRGLLAQGEMKTGDMLEIVCRTGGERNAYFQAIEDGEAVETVAVVPILALGTGEKPDVMVELSTQQVKTVLENIGFGIELRRSGDETEVSLQGESAQDGEVSALNGAASEEDFYLWLDDRSAVDVAPADGTYGINIRRISRAERAITEYSGNVQCNFPFASDCVFTANYEMAGVRYEEISFDAFAELIEECSPYLNKTCRVTFQNGEIVKADLESAYMNYGISFREVTENYAYREALIEGGEETATEGYALIRTETLDISDKPGLETAEIYAGDRHDGNGGGCVLFKDASGKLLWAEELGVARAGWGNIYFGELDGMGYILKLYIEDREDAGEYGYEVFRLAREDGCAAQIAGSTFEWGNGYVYDDGLLGEWVSGMERYLENSRLLLSTQDGEIRTERGSEANQYHYETLSLKDRM